MRAKLPLLSMLLLSVLVGVAVPVGGGAARAAAIVDPGFGPFAFSGGPWQLSGLTRVAGDQYYAVGDTGAPLVPLAIGVDPASGAITSVTTGAPVTLAGGVDLEGVAWDASTGTVLVSDETGAAIRRHDPVAGAIVGSIPVPAVFSGYRSNRSLESLSLGPSGVLWTANEDALLVDGPATSFAAGSTVRLQRFDAAGQPDGQWAYPVDPIPGSPLGGFETSGVSEVLALPSGELLVMERSLSAPDLFTVRIFQVDFAGATDTSALGSLASDPFAPVTKTLLWASPSLLANYEGLALGPQLDDGSHSLFLIADDNGGTGQALYPLRISFVPEPATATLIASALAVLAARRRL